MARKRREKPDTLVPAFKRDPDLPQTEGMTTVGLTCGLSTVGSTPVREANREERGESRK
jgi:hypothetical protein